MTWGYLSLLLAIAGLCGTVTSSHNKTDCVQVGRSTEICNVTETWSPRISLLGGTAAVLVPTLFSAGVNLIGIYWLLPRIFRVCKNYDLRCADGPNRINICCCSLDLPSWWDEFSFRCGLYAPLFPLLVYDTVDVCLDCLYFFKVEFKEQGLLNDAIVRNPHVSNAILAFACLGALKSVIIVGILLPAYNDNYKHITPNLRHNTSGYEAENAAQPTVELGAVPHKALSRAERSETSSIPTTEGSSSPTEQKRKITLRLGDVEPLTSVVFLLFEDGVEMFLEYYFIDKYHERSSAIVLINATLMAVVSSVPIISQMWKWRGKVWKQLKIRTLPVFLSKMAVFTIAVGQFIRACSCWYVAYSGVVDRACLTVSGGAMYQTPFTAACMMPHDWAILVCTALSIAVGVLVVPVSCVVGINSSSDQRSATVVFRSPL